MSTFLYRLGKSAYTKPWYFLTVWILILGVIGALLGVNGIQSSSEMKIEGTESQKVLDMLVKELPAAAGGQASVAFTAPDGERLDTPERSARILKAINDVYSMDYIINPAELAAQAAAAAGQAAGADPSAAASGQTATADPSAAAGQTDAADPSAAASQTDVSGQATAAAQAAPYGPLIVDGAPVPGVMLSADGSIALFQFQFTVQQTSLPLLYQIT